MDITKINLILHYVNSGLSEYFDLLGDEKDFYVFILLLENSMCRLVCIGNNEVYTLNKRLFLNFPQIYTLIILCYSFIKIINIRAKP
ncbi:hypothetical protein AK965_05470 [Vibrio sp. PID17_43]|nr:hypothetical protein AK965_05470 [Vibrio sp. PID17_43]